MDFLYNNVDYWLVIDVSYCYNKTNFIRSCMSNTQHTDTIITVLFALQLYSTSAISCQPEEQVYSKIHFNTFQLFLAASYRNH